MIKWEVKKRIHKIFWGLFTLTWFQKLTRIVLMGSKRSGKSYTTARFLIYWMIIKDANIIAFRKVKEDIGGSVFKELKQAIFEMGLTSQFKINYAPMSIVYIPTGAEIIFRGMNTGKKSDNTAGQRLGSFTFSKPKKTIIAWMEEAFEFDDIDKKFIIGSLSGAQHALLIETLNAWDDSKEITKEINTRLNPDEDTMKKHFHKMKYYEEDKTLFISVNYKINEHNLSELQIQEMKDTEINRPKIALAFCWGCIGVDGDITYPNLTYDHIVKDKIDFKYVRAGIDYADVNDSTTIVMLGLPLMRDEVQILAAYSWSNKGKSKQKNYKDFSDDVLKFFEFHYNVFPQLQNMKINIYIDYANGRTFYQHIKVKAQQTKMKNGMLFSQWLHFKLTEKPKIKRRIDVENYMIDMKKLTFYYNAKSFYNTNKIMPSYFYKVQDTFLEFYNSKKELKQKLSINDGVSYHWVRIDGGDDLLNAVEYALSKDWKILSKGSGITWKDEVSE